MRIIKVEAKKAFYPSRLPGADYVINQYIGCQHACKYCYAKFVSRWYNYGSWGEWVVVKENMPELVKDKFVKGVVYMSSISDAYQPIEQKLKLTRRILQNMNKRIKLSVLTKSSLVLRDIDIFKQFKNIEVGLTINGFPLEIKNQIEPFSSSHLRRIHALEKLHQNGVTTYAFISPIIPGLVDVKGLIDETRSFVDFYWFELLNLRPSGEEFRTWLRQNYKRAHDILTDKNKLSEYVKDLASLVRSTRIASRGISVHYQDILIK